jgi:phosphoribosylanthranilate isomerase
MTLQAKICGINSRPGLDAAIAGGASFVGFQFYPRSPRVLTSEAAAQLAAAVPPGIRKVAIVVDEPDTRLAEILSAVSIDLLQLHGKETPARVGEIKERFGLPVMKAISVAAPADLAVAETYLGIADWLLFDAKPPPQMTNALPGGNALSFDWQLLAGRTWSLPWMLSGGLNVGNLAEAVRICGAAVVDVSSGVEDKPGLKSPAKITAFLELVARL